MRLSFESGIAALVILLLVVSVLVGPETRAASAAGATEDLGSVGPSWPIAEPDLLASLVDRARNLQQSGAAEEMAARLRESAQRYASVPPSLGLPRATQDRSSTQDPSVVVPYDVVDGTGHVLWPAGTRVNPLQQLVLTRTMVFVDAADSRQVAWLRRRVAAGGHASDKLILTGGSPGQLARELGRPVYFDQQGALVRRFGIAAVPATVGADPAAPRERLVVREIDPQRNAP